MRVRRREPLTVLESLDGGVDVREAVEEDARHHHANDLDHRNAQDDTARQEELSLDFFDEFGLTIFRYRPGGNGTLGVRDDRSEWSVDTAAFMRFLELVPLLFRHRVPNDFHQLVECLSDGLGSIIVWFSGGGDEKEEAAKDDRHQEADEKEGEEHAQAASRFPNGSAAAEESDDGNDAAQSDDEQWHVIDVHWNLPCRFFIFTTDLQNHVDEVFVDLSPYSHTEEKNADEPKQQVKGEKKILGQSCVTHFASGTKCRFAEDDRDSKKLVVDFKNFLFCFRLFE